MKIEIIKFQTSFSSNKTMSSQWLTNLPCVKTLLYAVSLRVRVQYCISNERNYVSIENAIYKITYLRVTYDRKNNVYELLLIDTNDYSIDISQLTEADLKIIKTKCDEAPELYSAIEEIWRTGCHQETANLFDALEPNNIFK